MTRNEIIQKTYETLFSQGESHNDILASLAERHDLTTERIKQIVGVSAKEAKKRAKAREVEAYSETVNNNIDSDNPLELVWTNAPEADEFYQSQSIAPDLSMFGLKATAPEPKKYVRSSSGATPEQIKAARERFDEIHEQRKPENTYKLLSEISNRIGNLESKVNAPFVHTPDRDVKVELSREVTTEVFLSDIHLHPEHSQGHDPAALALIEQVIKAIQPDIIYFGGDIGDYYAASRYDGVPILKTPEAYEGEIEYVRQRVGEIIANAPNARVYWDDEDGNHGRRMKKSVFANAPWLINRIKNVEADLDLERFDVKCVRDGFKVGKLAHWHGDDLPGAGAHIAKAKFMRELDNIIFGHHHNFSEHIQKKPDGGYYGAFGNGCLQWLSTDYAPRPNWQQGARVVQYSKSGNFHVDKILVHKPSVWSPHAETIYAGTHFKVDMSK
jgi:hypothetical protein